MHPTAVAGGLALSLSVFAAAAYAANGGVAARASVLYRAAADGPGPSHVAGIGDLILVVDPHDARLNIYRTSDLLAERQGPDGAALKAASCPYPVTFNPWRLKRTANSLLIVNEPERRHGAFRPTLTLAIPVARLKAAAKRGSCSLPAPRSYRARTDAARPISRPTPAGPVIVPARGPADGYAIPTKAYVIRPQAKRGQILTVRELGEDRRGRPVTLWKELAPRPEKEAPDQPGDGQVDVAVFVGVGGASGRWTSILSVPETGRTARGGPIPGEGFAKRGFDYAGVSSTGAADFLVLLYNNVKGGRASGFRLELYDLTESHPAGDHANDRLVLRQSDPAAFAAKYAEDAGPGAALPTVEPVARPVVERGWKTMDSTARAYLAARWRYPAAAAAVPCPADSCAVYLVDGRLAASGRPEQRVGTPWVRARNLVGLAAGAARVGVAYSIGGNDDPAAFAAKLSEYASPARAPSPVSHIGEGLVYTNPEGGSEKVPAAAYPAGIDCSAFLAKVWNVGWRITATMMSPGPNGWPIGPHKGCPLPVRRFSDLRPGDVLLNDGHVVIFAGMTPVGNQDVTTGSLGVRVYEAGSRCGRVCESVYDADAFNGWWMFRRQASDASCPDWKPAAKAALAGE